MKLINIIILIVIFSTPFIAVNAEVDSLLKVKARFFITEFRLKVQQAQNLSSSQIKARAKYNNKDVARVISFSGHIESKLPKNCIVLKAGTWSEDCFKAFENIYPSIFEISRKIDPKSCQLEKDSLPLVMGEINFSNLQKSSGVCTMKLKCSTYSGQIKEIKNTCLSRFCTNVETCVQNSLEPQQLNKNQFNCLNCN